MNTQSNSVVNFSRHNPSVLQPFLSKQEAVKAAILPEIMYLPTPYFLVDTALSLLTCNLAGRNALEQNLIRLNDAKLHFTTNGITQLVKYATQRVASATSLKNSPVIERLYLDIDGNGLRVISITKTNTASRHLLISIGGELGLETDQTGPCAKMRQFAKTFSLSKSETRVISLMIEGQKPKQIAYSSNISIHTVRSHLRSLYAKMQVRDFNDALILAVRLLASS